MYTLSIQLFSTCVCQCLCPCNVQLRVTRYLDGVYNKLKHHDTMASFLAESRAGDKEKDFFGKTLGRKDNDPISERNPADYLFKRYLMTCDVGQT